MIGGRIGEMGGFSYMEFIVPGLIMMSTITSSYANVSSSFFSQKFQKNIEELLVAPVPTHVIIWGFVFGGLGRSILVGMLVTVISLFLFLCMFFLGNGYSDISDDRNSFLTSWFAKWYLCPII